MGVLCNFCLFIIKLLLWINQLCLSWVFKVLIGVKSIFVLSFFSLREKVWEKLVFYKCLTQRLEEAVNVHHKWKMYLSMLQTFLIRVIACSGILRNLWNLRTVHKNCGSSKSMSTSWLNLEVLLVHNFERCPKTPLSALKSKEQVGRFEEQNAWKSLDTPLYWKLVDDDWVLWPRRHKKLYISIRYF